MADTITIYVTDNCEVFSEHAAEEHFMDMLDESYPAVSLGGCEYGYGRVWSEVDPIAYREAYLNFIDDWETFDVPWETFANDDVLEYINSL